jgi:uncharacterized protein YjiS (DUF1127 family)
MNTSAQTLLHTTALQRAVFDFVTVLRSAAAAWHRMRRQRADLRELLALDSRTLRDIGVNRSELPSLVAELVGAQPATRRHAMQSRAVRSSR